jgi:hypothetical protein
MMGDVEGMDEVLNSMPTPELQRFRSWWRAVPSAWVRAAASGHGWQALIAKAWATRASLQPVNRILEQDTRQQERKRFEPLLRAIRERAARHDEGWGDSVDAAAYDLWQLVPSDLRIDAGKEGDDGAAR